MKRQRSYKENEGKLYLVPTPIGNLQDMTFRSVEILQTVDVIAAEDTRNTIKLLNHFAISTPQISLHEHNYQQRIPQLIEKLQNGESIAQVSDAGMPSISDPGHELVLACIEENIPVIALPGATAGLTALIASGLSVQPFTFYGFLPRKKKVQQEALEKLKGKEETVIFYESPFRLKETLENILKVMGNRKVVICRELTKIYEEYLRGDVKELIELLSNAPLKGECVLMVEGSTTKGAYPTDIHVHFQELKELGLSDKEIIKEVAKIRQMKKQEVYKIFHEVDASF